ncbi:hypothetical protein GCM10010485_34510 [Streptosporangium carneum]
MMIDVANGKGADTAKAPARVLRIVTPRTCLIDDAGEASGPVVRGGTGGSLDDTRDAAFRSRDGGRPIHDKDGGASNRRRTNAHTSGVSCPKAPTSDMTGGHGHRPGRSAPVDRQKSPCDRQKLARAP